MVNFLGIGAQKSGTSWLHAMLALHPEIFFPGGKEVHFWDRRYDKGLGWYRGLFAQPEYDGLLQGDITPAYAFLEPSRVAEVRRFFPTVRIVYILRNPLERAWSSALMALERAELTIDEASDQWFLDHFRSAGSMRRGDYAACLQTWRAYFPDEQLLLLRYEMIAESPRTLLQRVAVHLGADPAFYATLAKSTLREKVFSGSGHRLRPSLVKPLRELYRQPLERLYSILGEDLGWLP